jgi:hypothetical protein
MKSVDFAVTISLSLKMKNGFTQVCVNNVELKPAFIALPGQLPSKGKPAMMEKRVSVKSLGGGKKKTLHDVVLAAAKQYTREKGVKKFSAADLYHQAKTKYPDIKKGSFSGYLIAAAPNHPSHKYYKSGRDYLTYLGKGQYRLKGGKAD